MCACGLLNIGELSLYINLNQTRLTNSAVRCPILCKSCMLHVYKEVAIYHDDLDIKKVYNEMVKIEHLDL